MWFTFVLFVVTAVLSWLLAPRPDMTFLGIKQPPRWWERLNWRAMIDVRMWWRFFNLWDVRIALLLAYWVVEWN
tara:strand:+ start:760 stop:981 length:222 start_codon:yes stop_codon:yes gene_type:complete